MLVTERVSTGQRSEVVDITGRVAETVRRSGVKEGLCVVYVPHTTAAVTINENADPDVKHDFLKKMTAMVPQREGYYQHGEGNSDSHVKTALVGPSVTLIIDKGSLALGMWQGIYLCEFDGPRTRQIWVRIEGE